MFDFVLVLVFGSVASNLYHAERRRGHIPTHLETPVWIIRMPLAYGLLVEIG